MAVSVRSCPTCGSDKPLPLQRFTHHHLVKCRSCNMTYVGRQPSTAELDAVYGDYPVHAGLNPITRSRYQDLLHQFKVHRRTGALLDAGSGSGFFLDVAMEHGWEAHGSEYDPQVVQNCRDRGIQMWQGAMDGTSFSANKFDVITSFEVLEHLVDPLAELKNFHRMLRPGGIVYLTTPNFNSLNRWLAGGNWSIVNYPEHLNYFTPSTLRTALQRAGLKVRSLRTTGLSPSRLINSRVRTSAKEANNNPGNTDQALRGKIESSRALRTARSMVNGILDITGRGDTIKVLCQKSS